VSVVLGEKIWWEESLRSSRKSLFQLGDASKELLVVSSKLFLIGSELLDHLRVIHAQKGQPSIQFGPNTIILQVFSENVKRDETVIL